MDIPTFSVHCARMRDARDVIALASPLRERTPDVVAFAGIDDEQGGELRRGLAGLYDQGAEGPHETGMPLADPELAGGGLLLLSRHAASSFRQTIYRQFSGSDALASKGVLHARVTPAGHPCGYDLFLTETQAPPAARGSCADAREACRAQIGHLGAFIAAVRDPLSPALLVGALHLDDHQDAALRAGFLGALGAPEMLPVTSDGFSAWVLPGRCFRTRWQVDEARAERGFELTLEYIDGLAPGRGSWSRARVKLLGVRCLQATVRPGADEVAFELTASCGRLMSQVRTEELQDMEPGSERRFDLPELLLEGVQNSLVVSCTGSEHGQTGGLGSSRLSFNARELAALSEAPLIRGMPLLTGDGGEYALRIQLTLE